MRETTRARLVPYGVALLATAGCLLVRWPLRPVLGDAAPHMIYFPAIMVAAYVGGFWPGMLATSLGAAAAVYFLTTQLPSFHGTIVNEVAALVLFMLVGTIISGLCESLHRARRRILADERRRAEEALSQERYLLHALMDNLPDRIYFKDADSRFLRTNKALATFFGLSDPAQAIGKTDFDFFAEEHARPAYEDEQEIMRSGQPVIGKEEKGTRLDGRAGWVSTTKMPLRDKDGTIIGTFGVSRNITELKVTEEALRESEQRWRNLTEALPQLVWSATPDGACDYFSTQWTEHTGVAEADLLGWRWLVTLHPDDREPTRHFWLESVADRHPYDVEYRVRRRDGEYRWFKTRGVPIRDRGGNIIKWFGTCTDITELRQTEGALRQAKEAAEAANRAKDEFLANVSHEIRTPMNAILGMTELALDTELTDDLRQCLQTVKSAADNLLGIINDLLDFAKIEAGKLELAPADFSLRAAIGDTLRALGVRAHKKGLELIYHVEPDVPDALVGDVGRLRQVLLNLVGNAIKFTHEGEVIVSVEIVDCRSQIADLMAPAESSSPDNLQSAICNLEFTVRDTGIGIPPDQQERIFRAFEQEDTSTTRKYGGTGLGLTIASRLVALMGGQITVQSEPGRGSTFAFTARFERRPDLSGSITDENDRTSASDSSFILYPSSLPLRILVAEDNEFNGQLLEQLLGRRGHRVRLAPNGREALRLSGEGGFDLLLLDVHMPELDGFQVAQAIRERERATGGHLPVIALTARSRAEDRARCLAAGMDDFLAKPIQAADLWATIDRVLRSRSQESGIRSQDRPVSLLTPDSCLLTPDPGLLAPRVLLAACGGDAVILGKICQTFRAGLPDHLKAIQDALRDQDTPRLREAAHKLSGMVAAFSTVAGELASELEDHAAQGQLEMARPLMERLETITGEVIRQVDGLSLDGLRLAVEAKPSP